MWLGRAIDRPGREAAVMQARQPATDIPTTAIGDHRLWSLLRVLAPGDEDALRAAAGVIARWEGVCGVTIEVLPERAGRAPFVVSAGRAALTPADACVHFDLVDRATIIGRFECVFGDAGSIDPRLPELCEAAAALLATAGARYRLDAMLLDAQSFEVAGQIAAGLVHDFNNMMTGIAGNAAIAHALIPVGGRAVVAIERIEDAARSASGLSRALLNFVRGTVGPELLSVNELASGTKQVLAGAVRDGVQVGVDLGQDVPPIVGEQALLQQAIVNLVLNAAQAIEGDGCITIRTRRTTEIPTGVQGLARLASAYVALAVTDTGCGIAPEHLDEVFRPFFSTKGSGGTGLGLNSVVQIARRHGGAVGVESRAGGGSTFTLYLPVEGDPWAAGSIARGAGAGGPRTAERT